jgi:shikimate dehydrogenase
MPGLVDGSTRLLGVVGDPIAQVRAPAVWTALFRYNAVNAVCVPMHVPPVALRTFFAGIRSLRNLHGLIVTIPHKPVALGLVDHASPRARQVGAVNVVVVQDDGQTRGDILDGVGFVTALRSRGQQIAGKRALVVGSGGVGSAIAFALAEAGARELAVSDIADSRARGLAARLQTAGFRADVSSPDPAGFELVVNATPLGMRPDDPLPLDCSRLESSAIVGDVVIHAGLTPVLAAARERGCYVQPGTLMTDYQIAGMAEFFGFDQGDWSAEAVAHVMADPAPTGPSSPATSAA